MPSHQQIQDEAILIDALVKFMDEYRTRDLTYMVHCAQDALRDRGKQNDKS